MNEVMNLLEEFFKLPTGLFLTIIFSIPFTLLGFFIVCEKVWKFVRK